MSATRTLRTAGKQITQIPQVTKVGSRPASGVSGSSAKTSPAGKAAAAPAARQPPPPPEPSRWRCAVCKFMNAPEADRCSTCKEPVTLQEKMAHNVDKEREIRAGGVARLPPAPASPAAAKAAAAVVSKPSAPAGGVSHRPAAPAPALPPPPAHRSSGGGGGGHENQISKANIRGVVHSRLNHDTAAYRGKFENENQGPPQKGANVVTLKSMTKNGFVSSATRSASGLAAKAASSSGPAPSAAPSRPRETLRQLQKSGHGHALSASSASAPTPSSSTSSASAAAAEPKKYFNPIEEKRLDPKWAKQGSGSSRNLIDMLQEACSGAAQASLKHTGLTVQREHKPMAGLQTAFEM